MSRRPYPFVRKDGRVVVDQLCRCGHSRANHFELFGACEVPALKQHANYPGPCGCRSFVWSCDVFQDGQTGFLA